MHIRPFFKMTEKQSFELLGNNFFGQLITCFERKIIQTYVPFIVDAKNRCVYGHIAKKNPHVSVLEKAKDLTVTYLANDAYISPSWYQSKEQVPTWNYQAIELKGKAMLYDDQQTLEVIDQLSQSHEAQFNDPWLINKVPVNKLEKMLKAIVGFRIDIAEINGQSKMSQNKSLEDQQSLINGLLTQPDHKSREVASIMKKGDSHE